jgi:hypothetical protein
MPRKAKGLYEPNEWQRGTLTSIGDAVITTDAEGGHVPQPGR